MSRPPLLRPVRLPKKAYKNLFKQRRCTCLNNENDCNGESSDRNCSRSPLSSMFALPLLLYLDRNRSNTCQKRKEGGRYFLFSNVKSKFMTFLLRALKRMAEVWSHIPAYIYISRVPTVSWNFWKREQSCILKRNSQFNKFFGDIGESMDNCGVSHTCCISWWFSPGFLQRKSLLTPFHY